MPEPKAASISFEKTRHPRGGGFRQSVEEIYSYGEFAACVAIWIPLLAGLRVIHRKDVVPRVPGRWFRKMGKTIAALSPLWDFSAEGSAPADVMTQPYVVIANHLSMADPFLVSSLPWDMQWVGKEELFRMPLLGLLFKLAGDIPLRRGSGDSVREMLDACRHALDNGMSVMLFPEGTRSRDGNLRPFKDGAFELAVEKKLAILPLAIAGTQDCLHHGVRLGRARAIVRVLEPIAIEGSGEAEVARVRDLARARIEAGMRELEAKLAAK